ncbi:YraN family protein [Acidocella sp.]|uniref:YraN family protein n=1 Tax=Acidocella sp. TaxID=50710 RepID=UPI0026117F19|nr:YraN family protein [Acidocella sp.]
MGQNKEMLTHVKGSRAAGARPNPIVNGSSQARRQAAEKAGRRAETHVADILGRRGFDILAHRFRTGAGEIDIIAANPRSLVFIEVKARRSRAEAAYAVSARQQTRLWQAAGIALATHPEWTRPETRFDVAFVMPAGVEIIEDAIRLNMS